MTRFICSSIRFFVLILLAGLGSLTNAAEKPERIEFFETRIRPVLAQDCYECHNSKGDADGGLVLDHRKGLLEGGDQGPAIVPGNPDRSLLIQAIRHDRDDLEMPSAAPKLDAAIIQDFEHWVRIGAPDPRDHPPTDDELAADTDWSAVMQRRKSWWSFQPISDHDPPAIDGVNHPVDRLIRNRLNEAGLKPAAQAEPQVLLRRLSFALTGLPPTEQQVDRFMQLRDPTAAVDQLIDELLDSPHFGERWARHWMDWLRYAESHGSEGDPRIENAHLYRDYLIRALNEDVPYDQLVREHIAGDLLAEPRLNHELAINESLIGTAHWRMVFHGFAPTDALDEKVRFTDDQINVFTKAFLGLTVSCARCHNHKFDAISQADYYALFGILGSTRPGRKAVDLINQQTTNLRELTELKTVIRSAVADVWLNATDDVANRLAHDRELMKNAGQPSSPLHLLHVIKRDAPDRQAFAGAWQEQVQQWDTYQESVAAYHQTEYPFEADFSTWYREGIGLTETRSSPGEFSIDPAGERALLGIYPGGVYSHLISQKHSARLTSPDFQLQGKNTLWLRVTGGGNAMARYVVQNYPRRGTVYPVKEFKSDDVNSDWQWLRYDVGYWAGDQIHIEMTAARDAPLLTQPSDRSWFGIHDAVLIPEDGTPPVEPRDFLEPIFAAAKESPPESFADLVAIYMQALTDSVQAWKQGEVDDAVASFLNGCLKDGLLPNDLQELGPATSLINRYRELENEIPVPTRVPTLAEWQAHDQPLYERGDHKQPLAPVSRRFLEAIDSQPYDTHLSGRLELAEDLLRDDNPFTRRVIVNRVWHHLFGRGIVPSVDNFGRMGEKPSHPELLDYLATRFVEDGWSLKKLIRLIVTSETWQQDSKPSPTALQTDPENQLLSHFNVQRLDAESIRDSLLVAAGTLDRQLYGPPVNGRADRRSVYVQVVRNQLDPFLGTFDAPVPFATKGRRDVTTVPAQSLALFNDPFVLALANRVAVSNDDEGKFVHTTWRRLLGRDPSPQEQTQAAELVADLRNKYAELSRQRTRLESQIADRRTEVSDIEERVRVQLARVHGIQEDEKPSNLKPMAHWDFEGNLRDAIGTLHGEPQGDARVENGVLVVDGKGWVSTPPLPKTLKAKTLQARVMLDNFDQRGGGVITVQTLGGEQFDSIVFAESHPQHWLAGSDHHRRTRSFDGTDEPKAFDQPVVFTIVYQSDGTIIGYRNGKPYGKPYKTDVQVFEQDKAHVVFGLRHGTNLAGNRMLQGKILDAALYDRALTPDEVTASATGDHLFISAAQIWDAMAPLQKQRVDELNQAIQSLESDLNSLGQPVAANQAYADLALAIFNMKEFIYVR
ncbi:DUF1553 domain-containing protein [Neorhodopirellula pilleata]|uniref:Planctomycete cytochrome C n=1 Tax=Neorhodopirellula pilleata TaxID=2714738 RepID=A0A5C6A6S6_9BACT|nr:DUF1553 domain-containing protein [Neorhodopirellula pilleata]TWT94988.1 Planctomycete cytochrome C [Neorhodopirellula pilleata]